MSNPFARLIICLALLVCACWATADEYRMVPVTGWNAGFLDQADVNKLLGVPGVGSSKGDVRNANCNSVLVQVRRRADVCYPSALGEPYMSGLSPANFNALQAMINAAHDTTGGKKRIEVHCWIVAFRTGEGRVYSEHSNPLDPENYWMTRDDTGVEPDDKAFDPGHPKAAQYVVDVCMDLVSNFDIDGIHFDYIRFTGSTQGYNPTSVARYNARYGLTGQPASGDELFKQWRRDQVTAVVRKVYAQVQAAKPWVKVSGSFIGGTPSPTSSTREAFLTSSAYSVYSDWDSWLQEGIVDFGAPMTYFDIAVRQADYTNWLNFQRDRKANRLMVPDAGVYLNYLSDAISMVQQTREASPAGNHNDGFGVYSYQSPYATNKSTPTYGSWSTFSSNLLSQVTQNWADVPSMPWKTAPTKGHIGGAVTDPGSQWADGAIVTITGPESRTMRCDGTGFYAFIDLTPGVYDISVTYSSSGGSRRVTVTAGAMTDGDIALLTDITHPVISDVQVSEITDGSAVVTWTTDDWTTSQVEYDLAPYYGLRTPQNPLLSTSHRVVLSGLNPGTSYHFRVRSSNGLWMTSVSADYPFTTQSVASAIIVDELDANCALTGPWITSTSQTGWNNSYEYKGGTTGTPTATATWTPALQRTGLYDVYVYYRAGANRTTDAQFTINHDLGSELVHVNQTINDRTWVRIGDDLQFTAGESRNVVLTNKTTQATDPRNVIADAVKFEYGGDTTPPVMTSVTDQKYTLSTTTLELSWSASDPESGVAAYRYAIGTEPGRADVREWTDAGLITYMTIDGLSLQPGHTYYVSARAINGAGLTSPPMSSSGVAVPIGVSSVVAAKGLGEGDPIRFTSASATGCFGGKFYIQDSNRISGIRVESSTIVQPNQTVEVFGRLGTVDGCERAIVDTRVTAGSMGPVIKPLAMIERYAGGGEGLSPGITGGVGLNNIGLLVRMAGKVTEVVSDGFYLDDGSRLTDETWNAGIKVWTGESGSATRNAYVTVTGVVSCRKAANGVIYPLLLKRGIN